MLESVILVFSFFDCSVNSSTEGGQCYDDMTIVKTASGSAYFCDLCETWNLSETASCFDVSLRVRLGRPLAVCSVLISGAFKQSAASLPLANFF